MSEPVVQTIVERDDWQFVLEGRGDATVVWTYHNKKPVQPEGRGGRQFRKWLPYPSGYFERSKKVISWCEEFAKSAGFREKELARFRNSPSRTKEN